MRMGLFTLLGLSLCAVNAAVAQEPENLTPVYQQAKDHQTLVVATAVNTNLVYQAAVARRIALRRWETQRWTVEPDYALGVNRFDVDGDKRVIGWKLTNSVYFGHQDGISGLSLMWQNRASQVSLSKDGVHLERRF